MKRLRSVGLFFAVLLFVLLGGVIALFLVQNKQWVIVRFPVATLDITSPFSVTELETPLSVLIAVAFGAGCALTALLLVPTWLRGAFERSRERRFIDALEGELTELRNLPVTSPAPLEDIEDEPLRDDDDDDDDDDDRVDDDVMLLLGLDDPSERGGSARPPR